MRMHEWMKYRDRQIRRALRQADDDGAPPEGIPETPRPTAPTAEADDTFFASEIEEEAPGGDSQTVGPQTREEVLESLAPASEAMRDRLEALLARQGQLPFELAPQPKPAPGEPRRVGESREELVSRLLDPTLTLQETALLLDVCPTTVRRYTNRGALRCMRTPGNQRRFRLSDILDFMEHREHVIL